MTPYLRVTLTSGRTVDVPCQGGYFQAYHIQQEAPKVGLYVGSRWIGPQAIAEIEVGPPVQRYRLP